MERLVKYYKGDLIEYSIFKLVDFYDPILRQPTIPWDHKKYDPKESEYLGFSLAETLQKLGGLGLSANQVGLPHKICVVNMGEHGIWTMFNPEIIEHGEKLSEYSEGCLSYPGLYLKLPRYDHIKVKFQAMYGQEVIHEFDGLTAVCVQHELDHLNGIVYTDKVSPIKLDQAKRKVKKNLKKMKALTESREILEMQQPTQEIVKKQEQTDAEKFVYSTG
jgi:peptide deformylase